MFHLSQTKCRTHVKVLKGQLNRLSSYWFGSGDHWRCIIRDSNRYDTDISIRCVWVDSFSSPSVRDGTFDLWHNHRAAHHSCRSKSWPCYFRYSGSGFVRWQVHCACWHICWPTRGSYGWGRIGHICDSGGWFETPACTSWRRKRFERTWSRRIRIWLEHLCGERGPRNFRRGDRQGNLVGFPRRTCHVSDSLLCLGFR